MLNKGINRTDLLAGLFFSGIATGGLWGSSAYRIGTLVDMGPGYFPFALSMLLLPVGLLVTSRAILAPSEAGEETPLSLRPSLAVLGATVLFALLVDSLGLFLTAVLVIVVGGIGFSGFRWKEVLATALTMATGCVLLFIELLALPISVWPRW